MPEERCGHVWAVDPEGQIVCKDCGTTHSEANAAFEIALEATREEYREALDKLGEDDA